jgi:hypothetical protein
MIIRQLLTDVRFTLKADKIADVSVGPLCANRVLTRRSKKAELHGGFKARQQFTKRRNVRVTAYK